jgi:TRAP-type uncharacterized transport system substrate-binding protein
MRPRLKERLQRVLGLPQRHFARPTALKLAVLGGVLVLLGLLAFFVDRSPNLAHLRVSVLSASERGNYYVIVNTLAAEARQQKGHIANVASTGSVENLARLVASQTACDVHFALVQDGIPWPAGSSLELIGRLSKAESLVFLGREADRIKSLQDLRGMRIGIGPIGSGTEHVARQALVPLAALDLTLSTPRLDEQLAQLERGELDLGAMVIDEDAQRLVEAVRDRQLQLLGLPYAEALARRLPFARVGRIRAGQYDPVRLLPGEDKYVLQIDTLIVGNRCARWSTTQAFLTVLATVFPDFMRHNRDTPNRTGLPLASAARSYFNSEGPDIVGVYMPWVADLMPTARWIQLFLGFTLIDKVMVGLHLFRLWRIDAKRVRIESAMPQVQAQMDIIMEQLATLAERCRRQSVSILVPMGQEMAYRYQEGLMADLLYALRAFRERLGP